jgi:hypothetical protein
MAPRTPDSGSRFVALAGVEKVYEPNADAGPVARKHPCPDCHFCQSCSDSRCQACRGDKNGRRVCGGRKLSVVEQIRLYDRINDRG